MRIFEQEESSRFVPFARGVNSICFTDGEKVVKVTSLGREEDKALADVLRMEKEYTLFKEYLGDYIIDSQLSLKRGSGEWLARVEQPFINGVPLRRLMHDKNLQIQEFYRRNLNLYNQTGIIPDLLPDIMFDPTGGIFFTGKFTYRSGPNTLVVDDRPILVDTSLNKSLRNRVYGSFVRSMLAFRLRTLLV